MQFDPLSPEFQRDPYPIYDQLRAAAPIFYSPELKLWFMSAYEDVAALLRDKRFGRSLEHIISREQLGLPPKNPQYAAFDKLSEHSMFDQEPPDHTRLKALVHKVFTPRRVESLRGQIEAISDNILDQVADQPKFDLLEDFAVPIPVNVIAELLGVPQSDRRYLRPWSAAIVAMYELNHTEAQAARAVQGPPSSPTICAIWRASGCTIRRMI